MSNRVVHFEIPSDNPEKAIAFFQTAFGWNFQKWERRIIGWPRQVMKFRGALMAH